MSGMTKFPIICGAAGGVLIASPSSALREQVLQRLNGRWEPVHQALGGAEALGKLEDGDWQVLFLDRRLPDLDSAELVAIIRQRYPEIQVVLLDSEAAFPADDGEKAGPAYPDPTARDGAHEEDERRGVEDRPVKDRGEEEEEENRYEPLPGMIGRSEAMRRVYRLAQLVAPRTTTVLIVGPTGSGKELVARALHELSPRPFVAVNCAAIPEALLESELFGHARGAFTGAVQAQVGRIPTAHGGTLFLDEVSELPFGMQAKLLRFLEQKEVQRLGTAELTRVDVRVVAASNVDTGGARGPGRISRGSVLSSLRFSPGTAAAHRAAGRHYSPGRALSGLHGSRDEWSLPAAEQGSGLHSRSSSLERQRARIAARNGAGFDTGGEWGHSPGRAVYFPFQHSHFQTGTRALACAGRAS
jgi:DNA-binding NtrC family response regulator